MLADARAHLWHFKAAPHGANFIGCLRPTKLALGHVMDKKPAAKFMAAGVSDVGRSSFSKIFLLK
jgi:hypothetical protein